MRANFFTEPVINCWNCLPDTVDLVPSQGLGVRLNKSIIHDFSVFSFLVCYMCNVNMIFITVCLLWATVTALYCERAGLGLLGLANYLLLPD